MALPMLADGMDIVSILFWSAVTVGVIFGCFIGYNFYKKWMKEDDIPSGGLGFSLGDLRDLHRQGKMTDAEFEKARSKMVSAAKQATAAMPDVMKGRRNPPPPSAGV